MPLARTDRVSDALLSTIPSPPREPSERARRLIFAYQGGQFVLLLVGGIFLAIGLLLSTIFCWGIPVDLTIALDGQKLQGEVVSAEPDLSTTINGVHPTLVRFTYRAGGERMAGSTSLMGEEVRQLVAGAPIALEVARGRPAWSRVAGGTWGFFGYWGAFTLFFPLLGGLLVGFAVRSNRREIRAFRFGSPTMARVVFAGPDRSTTVNGRHPFKLDWEFKLDEQVYGGSISSMKVLELEEFAERKELPVLFDPANPEINTLYVS